MWRNVILIELVIEEIKIRLVVGWIFGQMTVAVDTGGFSDAYIIVVTVQKTSNPAIGGLPFCNNGHIILYYRSRRW